MQINEKEYQFLQDATGRTSGTFNDLYAIYLRGLGFTGTLTDMIARNGSRLTPNTGVGLLTRLLRQQDGSVSVLSLSRLSAPTLFRESNGTVTVS